VIPAVRRSPSPYLRLVVIDGLAYLNGQLPYSGQTIPFSGAVGAEVSLAEAQECARLCALNALASILDEVGDLSRIRQLVRLTGYVAAAPGFTEHPAVMDAASAIFVEHLGDRGRHARTAIGVASLPKNAPVEIDVIFALHEHGSRHAAGVSSRQQTRM
jgi:enamine deaminase RidA (YjgF/YER057c/UK114 family)